MPIGFAESSAGEYTISLFYVVGIALISSWFVAVLFAPLLGMAILKLPSVKAASAEPEKPGAIARGATPWSYVTSFRATPTGPAPNRAFRRKLS